MVDPTPLPPEWVERAHRRRSRAVEADDASGHIRNMSEDLVSYRLDQAEKRADRADERMGRIEDKLDRVLEKVSSLPTTAGLWTMVATVIGVSVGVLALIVAVLTWLQAFHK